MIVIIIIIIIITNLATYQGANAPSEVRCRPNVFTKIIRRQRLDTN